MNHAPTPDLTQYPLVFRWQTCGFTLDLRDTGKRNEDGKHRLAYQFRDGKEVIFEGDDFYPAPTLAIDSLECALALVEFFTLGPDDVDPEYFADYTPAQIAWRDSESREELQALAWLNTDDE